MSHWGHYTNNDDSQVLFRAGQFASHPATSEARMVHAESTRTAFSADEKCVLPFLAFAPSRKKVNYLQALPLGWSLRLFVSLSISLSCEPHVIALKQSLTMRWSLQF